MAARNKARKALATINRQRKRDTSIREYTFPLLILYFLRNPEAETKDILLIVKEAQTRLENGATAQSNGSYRNVKALLERHRKQYLGYMP